MMKRILTATLSFGFAASVYARDNNAERGVTSGISYVNPNHALFMNPASLAEASQTSLEGVWLFDPGSPHVSLAGSAGSVGLAAGWRQDGGDGNIFEAGLGFDLKAAKLGLTLRSWEGGGLDGDIGFLMDLSALRIAAVARGLSAGPDRLDASVGFDMGQAVFEADVKKPRPFDTDTYFLNAGLGVNAKPVSVGVGYDFSYAASDFHNGGFNASVAFEATQALVVEAFYRPFAQEWVSSDWALGVRYTF